MKVFLWVLLNYILLRYTVYFYGWGATLFVGGIAVLNILLHALPSTKGD